MLGREEPFEINEGRAVIANRVIARVGVVF